MIEFWWIGVTKERYLQEGIKIYLDRIKHYTKFEERIFKDVKKIHDPNQLRNAEGEKFIKSMLPGDFIVLLDEKGKAFTSVELAASLEKWQAASYKRIIFIVAGAFGASEDLARRADLKLSLSAMTFSHQMIRLFFIEQIYRAFTILKNEKYHNE